MVDEVKMILYGNGSALVGASITLTKDCKIYSMRLIDCIIDDIDADKNWAIGCVFYNCEIRSRASYKHKPLSTKYIT